MNVLVKISTKAPMPEMHPNAAPKFEELRQIVFVGSGVDFLAVCGDVCRDPNFVSSKDGVANRSWHKTGRAFDYDQNSKFIVIVSEIKNYKQYFRTYIICARQDGSLGKKLKVRDYRGNYVDKYLFDFTEAAESLEWKRIPAWNGWQSHYNRREFWHYQFDEGLTWDAAMLQLRGKFRPAQDSVLGLNDRGEEVRKVQNRLSALGFLPQKEVDGVFGAKTKAAVIAFQQSKNIGVDGLIGQQTRSILFL